MQRTIDEPVEKRNLPSTKAHVKVTEEDVWDDTELIRAYDKAVKQWKKTKVEVATTSPTPGPGPWIPVDVDVSQQNISNLSENFSTITFTNSPSEPVNRNPNAISSENDNSARAAGGKFLKCDAVNENPDLTDFMPHFPVPPMPASLACPDGTFNYGKGELPALLLSWYMAGYQAGYFDAKRNLETKGTLK